MPDSHGRNKWTEADFRQAITRAGKFITCSWGVAGLRDKRTGKYATVLILNDDDKGEFAYAFAFEDPVEVFALCNDLMKMAKKIRNGEIGAQPPKI